MRDIPVDTESDVWASTISDEIVGLTTDLTDDIRRRGQIRYYLTLAGNFEGPVSTPMDIPTDTESDVWADLDSIDDLDLSMSSFSARLRNGDLSYLTAVIPTDADADGIADRSGNEMILEQVYLVDGAEAIREELCRATLEDIRHDVGASSKSITLTGHSETTRIGRNIDLGRHGYYSTDPNGLSRYRFAGPHPYLKVGDNLTIGGVSFIVAALSMSATASQQSMEASESA